MRISVYDENLNRILIIGNHYVSCFWSEGYNTVENFTLELIATDEYKKKIRTDCFVGRDDRKTMMVIKTVNITNGIITASGKQAGRLLDDVSFIGTIKSGSMLDLAVKEAYNKSEKYPNLEFADTNLQIPYNHQISHKSFLGLCTTMGQSEDVGFKVINDDGRLLVKFYQPEYNPNFVFAEKYGNLILNSISMSTENLKNYAIVLGAGEGENRKVVRVDASNGGQRFDLIVDARDLQPEEGETEAEYEKRLVSRGAELLLEKTETFACSFEPNENDFGVRYDLGDVLNVYLTDYNIKLQARISKFTQKAQKNKTQTTVFVGKITIKR